MIRSWKKCLIGAMDWDWQWGGLSLHRRNHERISDRQHFVGRSTGIMKHIQAPRPSAGPHKLRECLPLIVFLRNRLKYALTKKEVMSIMMQRLIKVDGKVRTDSTYPAGFMGGFLSGTRWKIG